MLFIDVSSGKLRLFQAQMLSEYVNEHMWGLEDRHTLSHLAIDNQSDLKVQHAAACCPTWLTH